MLFYATGSAALLGALFLMTFGKMKVGARRRDRIDKKSSSRTTRLARQLSQRLRAGWDPITGNEDRADADHIAARRRTETAAKPRI